MSRPNVVIIMTDQQQARMSAREGFPADTTPFVDRLAEQGTAFSNAYTTSPICTPARISLLTGRYPSAHGGVENHRRQGDPNFADPWITPKEMVSARTHLFEVLGRLGYRRALIGKNHAHLDNDDFEYVRSYHHHAQISDEKSPGERAFDEWLESLDHRMSPDPAPFPPELQLPHRMVTDATRWVALAADGPFALWLSFPEPHNPYQVPEPYYSLFDGDAYVPPVTGRDDLADASYRWRAQDEMFRHSLGGRDVDAYVKRARTNYMGMLRLLDDEIGRFIGFLREHGFYEETLIVVLSDHGDLAGEFGLLRKGLDLSEFLIRVPLMFAGHGVAARGVDSEHFASIADVFPTVCDALGVEAPPDVQGRSLWPFLNGSTDRIEGADVACCEWGNGRPMLTQEDFERDRDRWLGGGFQELNAFVCSGAMRSIRKGDWKLIVDSRGCVRLYDLREDPCELDDLSGHPAHKDVREELLRELVASVVRLQSADVRERD